MNTGFFAVGLEEWRQACNIGLNAACSFIVLACGTGRDNSTTAWSANAVQTYAGISWVRAQPAIKQLADAELLTNTSKTKKPKYKLKIGTERIWLPKSIVMPIGEEIPAILRLRQVQDVMLLRLFIELYFSQNLAADGGLSRKVYYAKYEKTSYAEVGPFIFMGFDRKNDYVSWATDITSVHKVEVSKAEEKEGKNPGHVFFKRIQALRDLGLLEYSICLFEGKGDDAEILFPITGPTEIERTMEAISATITESQLQQWQVDNAPHQHLIPIFRHQEQAEAFGLYRLRHRPQTALTSAWWAVMHEKIEGTKKLYMQAS